MEAEAGEAAAEGESEAGRGHLHDVRVLCVVDAAANGPGGLAETVNESGHAP